MRLHILVEGPADAVFLTGWLPRFLPSQHSFKIHPHEGKGRLSANFQERPDTKRRGLLDLLPATLRAFGRSLDSATERVLVLVDLDHQSCVELKQRLVDCLESCNPAPTAFFRIAIEELEAFYLGDEAALKRAFPQAKISKMRTYEQDSICGTWETFQSVIGAVSEDKPGWARRMALHLRTDWRGTNANRSSSFRQFCQALLILAGEPIDR